jgi:hypothetical protein
MLQEKTPRQGETASAGFSRILEERMNDPRTHPVPGAEIEVLGKNKSSRRRVYSVAPNKVIYYKPCAEGLKLAVCNMAAWRKWAYPGRVVSRGQE